MGEWRKDGLSLSTAVVEGGRSLWGPGVMGVINLKVVDDVARPD